MKIIACKIRKEHAELFKKYAADNGTTPNALLKSYILKTIGENESNNKKEQE